jgi:hypothetical protein
VLFPAPPELLREVLELRVDVLRAHDLLAEDALVEPAGDGADPLDVVHAGEHRRVLTSRRAGVGSQQLSIPPPKARAGSFDGAASESL